MTFASPPIYMIYKAMWNEIIKKLKFSFRQWHLFFFFFFLSRCDATGDCQESARLIHRRRWWAAGCEGY